MATKDPKEVFLTLLSDVRQNTERAGKIYQEMGQVAEDPQIKEALEARAFVSEKTLEKLDQCFKLVGEQPVKLNPISHRQAPVRTGKTDPSHPPAHRGVCGPHSGSRSCWAPRSGRAAGKLSRGQDGFRGAEPSPDPAHCRGEDSRAEGCRTRRLNKCSQPT